MQTLCQMNDDQTEPFLTLLIPALFGSSCVTASLSVTSSSFSGSLRLLVQTVTIVRQQVQHPFSPHPHSPSSPSIPLGTIVPPHSILGFPFSGLRPLLVYHSSIHPHSRAPSFCYSPTISPLQRFLTLSLSLTLFFFSPQTMQCFLAATMVVVQAKSQTTCPV